MCLSGFTSPKGPSGGTEPPVGHAAGGDPGEGCPAAEGPETPTVLPEV